MPIDRNILDEVSRDFFAYIAEYSPDWLTYVRSLPIEENSDVHHLEIEFPNHPGTERQEPLWISTYGGEVTVGMDAHHTHFPWPTGYNGEDGRQAAISHIDALMQEEKVVVSIWQEGRARASRLDLPEQLAAYLERPDGPMELRIRSWRGSYNRTLRFDWDSYLRTIRDSSA